MKTTYARSGVNISEGDKFIESIKPLTKKTFNKHVLSGIGNFASFYEIPASYIHPVFVASTDGVGTKLKIAIELNNHSSVGEDLVNHCVNDIAVCGATPLFFLDYMAFGKLKKETALKIVEGIVRGCLKNNCALIGGETAEMPGIYSKTDYDLAGTIVGVVEKKKIINKKNVKAGDILVGLSSNGLHTNGYSLARRVFSKKIILSDYVNDLSCTLGEELLRVHRSYLNIIKAVTSSIQVSSISHITGGGMLNNTKRVIPDNLKIKIDWSSWERKPIFNLIGKIGNIDENEMRKVFNLGIGLIFILRQKHLSKLT